MRSTLERLAEARRRAKASDYALAAEAEEGFTLIELMVVLLIMAILLAIAIPTFLGVTKSAHNRAAQSNLRNAFDTAQTIYQSNEAYLTSANTTTMTAAMNASEPGLDFVTSGATLNSNSDQVSVDVLSGNAIVLAALAVHNCWFLGNAETNSAASYFHHTKAGTYYAVSNKVTCNAEAYSNLTKAEWQKNKFPSGPTS